MGKMLREAVTTTFVVFALNVAARALMGIGAFFAVFVRHLYSPILMLSFSAQQDIYRTYLITVPFLIARAVPA